MRFYEHHRLRHIVLVTAGIFAVASPARTQTASSDDFADKSIEELMNVDVTTASRKEQKLSKVPAAVYVITEDAIQRSGATNIPDLLRMVPGVQVAQVEANRWAVSVRGFNSSYSNKLLVLVDGRTVYTPSFSGVYWDQLDIPLDTIERIEVVRGSGGAVWGANAVDGVINIITKAAKDTEGVQVQTGGGSQEHEDFEARVGQKLGTWGSYRLFGDYRDFEGFTSPLYAGRPDGWKMAHGGFRLDARLTAKDQFSIDGDGFETSGGELLGFASSPDAGVLTRPLDNDGFHVLARWTHTHSDNSESSLQIYDSEYNRTDTGLLETSNTVDVDFQNRTQIGSRNDIVWGAGYRFTSDGATSILSENQALLTGGMYVSLNPANMQFSLFSGFVQDEITLSKSVSLTAGTKVEHNAFSGPEVEPTLRILWTPTNKATVWAAASRSVRQPSRIETAIAVDFVPLPLAPGVDLYTHIAPNPNIASETAMTYEAGYRVIPASRISVDLATFYTDYRDLHVDNPGSLTVTQAPSGYLLNIPATFGATGSARNFGSEIVVTTNVMSRWKLAGNYSWLNDRGNLGLRGNLPQQLSAFMPVSAAAALTDSLSVSAGSSLIAGSTPNNAFSVQSYFDLTRKWNFDQSVYFVGALSDARVPAYTRVDLHTSYKVSTHLQGSIVGQNLLEPRHLEFSEPSQFASTEPERSIFGKLTWSF